MPFTTITFLVFFAVLFFAYYGLPQRFQWHLLLFASLVFYGWTSPYCLIFLAVTILITYIGAVGIDKNLRIQKEYLKGVGSSLDREAKKAYKGGMQRRRKWMVGGVVVGLLAMLATFKYGQFLLDNVAWLGGALGWKVESTALNLILPIGLSFYVFQSLGYCIDVYREEVPAERNFLKHALYVSFFPQVMQGPIGTYSALKPQLFAPHSFDYIQAVYGVQRVAWGLFKKFMIANSIADRLNMAWGAPQDYPGVICWVAFCGLYAIQLYADFSGYMDIACGCSQMLGVKMEENFETPYFTKSIAEFWRKWHITLGVWFKNYVFYPILRSDWNTALRKRFKDNAYLTSTLPTVVGLLIVWLLIGLWHGADWSYVVYGLYHGTFIILAVILAPLYGRFHAAFPRLVASKAYAGWQIVRTFAIVAIGYAVFKPANLNKTWEILRQCGQGNLHDSIYLLMHTLHHSFGWVIVWILALVAVDVWHLNHAKGTLRAFIRSWPMPLRWALYFASLIAVIFFGLYTSNYNQFEYFKF